MFMNFIFLRIPLKLSNILFILSFIVFFNLLAQNSNLKFKQLSINNGLSYSIVTCVIQDKDGFLWFGTKNGLNKYDGYKFTIYKNNPLDSTSLSYNWMYGSCLLEDNDGKIWVGTQNGLNRFDKATEKFERYNANQISSSSIGCLYMDYTKNVWVGTYSGLNLYNKATNSFFQYRQNTTKAIQEDFYTKILDKRDGNLILATKKGLWLFNIKNKTFSQHPSSIENSVVANSQISDILEDNEKNLWICTANNGLFCYNNNNQTIHFSELKSKKEFKFSSIYFGFQDVNNDLWFGTDGDGLYKYSSKNHTFQKYHNSGNEFNSITSNAIYACCEDRSKLLWFGTMNGISYLDKKLKFDHYQRVIIDDNYTLNNYVTSFAKDSRGKLWIGTDGGGLCLYDRKTGKIEPYRYNKKLKSLKVIDLAADTEGKLWVGTWNGGLHCIDVITNEIKNFMPEKGNSNSIMSPNIMAMTIDHNNNLWIASFLDGISYFDKNSESFFHILPSNDIYTTISNYVYALNKDSYGNVWIGNLRTGINRLVYDKNKPINDKNIKLYRYSNNLVLAHKSITAFFEDSNFNLWIGSQNGLVKFNYKNEVVKVYLEKDGLPGNAICGILEDSHENLWISSNKGISKFDRKSNTFRNYDSDDGLQSNQFNNHACFKDNDGTMYFGGVNGFNVFHPDSIVDNQYIPPVVLTDFKIFMKSVQVGEKVNGRIVLTKSISMLKELELRYDESMITFEFAALNYIFPEKNQYAYILEGFDNSIHYVGNERSATYTNLNQGEYTFKVIASNNDGLWNNTGVSINITILPPWWKSWWAYVIYLLVVLAMLYYYRRRAINKEKIRSQIALERLEFEKTRELNQKNIEVEQMKITFFTNISHELRTPLTLIIGPLEQFIANEKLNLYANTFRLMLRNAQRLLQLINQILGISKLEAQKMQLNVSQNDICQFINSICDSFKRYAEQRNITFQINHKINTSQAWFDAEKVEIIICNLLSNAFKYTAEKGRISIDTQIIENVIEIKVQDNGIGIAKEHLNYIFDRFYQIINPKGIHHQIGTGIGLALVKNLIELHHGTISVQSDEDIGTTFTVSFPISKEYYNVDELKEQTEKPLIGGSEFKFLSENNESLNVQNNISESPDSTHKPLMLIVDDNEDVREYLKSIFTKQFRIEESRDGEDALKIAASAYPDIIICDVMMPKIDGLEFCYKLKTNEYISHIPVILLTARSSEEYIIKGYETGADDYVTKPFSVKLLEVRVQNLMDSRKKMRLRFSQKPLDEINDIAPTNSDETFLNRVLDIIEKFIADEDFDAEMLAKEMGIGRTFLYAKIKALTEKSVHEFVKIIRLKKAAKLLSSTDFSVKEISYLVGFKNANHFMRCFKEQFGETPSQFSNRKDK